VDAKGGALNSRIFSEKVFPSKKNTLQHRPIFWLKAYLPPLKSGCVPESRQMLLQIG